MSCSHSPRFVVLLGMGHSSARSPQSAWFLPIKKSTDISLFSQLLTLDEKDPKRLFEGNALIRRLVRVGVLDDTRMKLDYVLALKVEDFLERRLQTCVYKLGLAKSIHHARVLIKQRHIRYGITIYIVALNEEAYLLTAFGGSVLESRLSTFLLSLCV